MTAAAVDDGAVVALPARPSVAVVIACYTEDRWDLTIRAIESARAQTVVPDRIIVVVDHNEPFRERLAAVVSDDVTVLSNNYGRGAGGARNTAALHVDVDLLAFLDDDAEAYPEWLAHLIAAMESSGLVGAGGTIEPDWETAEPSWFPPEFAWAVGGRFSAAGRDEIVPVRNVWSANLIVDRASFVAVGGFRPNFGKVGDASEPEDTELCLRLSSATGKGWAFVPLAAVRHYVPANRAGMKFFINRCWLEGRGKAALRAVSDTETSVLSEERAYLLRTLPRGFVQHIGRGLSGDIEEFRRAALMVVGVVTTCGGFGYVEAQKSLRAVAGLVKRARR